jgi:hypothetical protein
MHRRMSTAHNKPKVGLERKCSAWHQTALLQRCREDRSVVKQTRSGGFGPEKNDRRIGSKRGTILQSYALPANVVAKGIVDARMTSEEKCSAHHPSESPSSPGS